MRKKRQRASGMTTQAGTLTLGAEETSSSTRGVLLLLECKRVFNPQIIPSGKLSQSSNTMTGGGVLGDGIRLRSLSEGSSWPRSYK